MRIVTSAAVCGLVLLFGLGAADAPKWRENATRLEYDGDSHRHWANSLGDWLDADGKPLGAKPFGATQVPRGGGIPITVEIDVTKLVRAYGADFRINTINGFAMLASREASQGGPLLKVTKGGATATLKASADTFMDATTVRPLGELDYLHTRYGALVRFDQPADASITRAVLVLDALNRFGDGPRFMVFRPTVLSARATVTPGATYGPELPDRLITAPDTAAVLKPAGREPAANPNARVLLNIKGSALAKLPNNRMIGDVDEAWFEGDGISAASDILTLPGARTEAFLTVVMKLDANWTAPGGKFPGLSNTGNIAQPKTSCMKGGSRLPPSGWGGRPADGCHWSARTMFRAVSDGSLGGATYAYALSPRDVNGISDYWSLPYPRSRWFAYVEHVKLNTPGHDDGEIAYWLVDAKTARGGKRVQAARGLVWRDMNVPESAINEVWADVYCGGRDCGAAPWPRSTMYLKRLTVTDSLPDLRAIQAEVDRLNAAGA